MVAQERSYGDQVKSKRSSEAIRKRRLKQSNNEELLELQKYKKAWTSEAKLKSSWMTIGIRIDLMLKTAYGVEILRFPIEFHEF